MLRLWFKLTTPTTELSHLTIKAISGMTEMDAEIPYSVFPQSPKRYITLIIGVANDALLSAQMYTFPVFLFFPLLQHDINVRVDQIPPTHVYGNQIHSIIPNYNNLKSDSQRRTLAQYWDP